MSRPILLITINNLKDISCVNADAFALGYEKYTFFAPHNFSYEEIKSINTEKTIFVILNALLHENDIDGFKKEVDRLKGLGVGFIVQDLGALSILIDSNIELVKIIYNPYTLICNKNDFKAYQKSFGVSLGLSTQLKVEEIEKIIEEPNALVEIYGYEPIYQTYRKVLSLYEEARDIKLNRKDLAVREDTREEKYPIVENQYGSVIFNYKKVNLIKDKEKLKNARYWYIDGSGSSLEEINEVVEALNDE